MEFTDKITLPLQTNVGFANMKHQSVVHSILVGAGYEVENTDMNTVLQNICIKDMELKTAMLVWNLKETLKYVREIAETTSLFDLLCITHSCLCKGVIEYGELGVLRNEESEVDTCDWDMGAPLSKEEITKLLEEANSVECESERAIRVMLAIMKCQPFPYGSNMVAQIMCNTLLVGSGHGIFFVPEDEFADFFEKVKNYFETNDETIFEYIFENCIQGL